MPASTVSGSPRMVQQTVFCLVTVSTNTVKTKVNGLVIILTCALKLTTANDKNQNSISVRVQVDIYHQTTSLCCRLDIPLYTHISRYLLMTINVTGYYVCSDEAHRYIL